MKKAETAQEALARALLSVPGGVSGAARALGVSRQAIHKSWMKNGVPLGRVAALAKLSGVPAHELRPDLSSMFNPPNGASHGKAQDTQKALKTQGKS